jgi:hypothetical protein
MSKFERFKKSIITEPKALTDADILKNIDSYVDRINVEAAQMKPSIDFLNGKSFLRKIEIKKKPAKSKIPPIDKDEIKNVSNKKSQGILDMYRCQKAIRKIAKVKQQ